MYPEYVIVSDDDGHYYVIPDGKRSEWCAWVESGDCAPPDWCESVGGAISLVKFQMYRIE